MIRPRVEELEEGTPVFYRDSKSGRAYQAKVLSVNPLNGVVSVEYSRLLPARRRRGEITPQPHHETIEASTDVDHLFLAGRRNAP